MNFLFIRHLDWSVLGVILLTKIVTFLIIFLGFSFLPFGKLYYFSNFSYPLHTAVTLQTAYSTWDAQHYLYLSQKGYTSDQDSNAFSPLFPFFIFLLAIFTKNYFISGLVIANVTSIVAFYCFYLLIKKKYTRNIAYTSLLLLLAFPTSFYFSLIYTESFFLLLVILFFWGLEKKNLLLSSIATFLLPFTRVIGIAIVLPFIAGYLFDYHQFVLTSQVIEVGKSFLHKKALFLVSPLLGFILLLFFMFAMTGNAFAQFIAQRNFISQYSFFSLLNPIFFLRALFTFPLSIHGFTNSVLDRLFFLCFLGMLYPMGKRVSLPFFTYAIIFGLLPVLSGSFMSYMRYLVIIFPLYITLAMLLEKKQHAWAKFPIFYSMIMLQTLFLIMHALNYWVA